MGKAPPNSQIRLAALAADEHDPYIPIPPRTEGYDHYFLGAIDKALAVFPKDRLQSAVEWTEEIDQARRQLAMRERAKKDQALDIVIRELTIATNKELEAGAPAEQSVAARLTSKFRRPAEEKTKFSWDLDEEDDGILQTGDDCDPDDGLIEVEYAERAPTAARRRRPLWLSLLLLPFLPLRLIAGRRRSG